MTNNEQKEQILKTDRDFSRLSKEKGMAYAFDFYMADNATILRDGNFPFTGREAINSLFAKTPENASLIWESDFADISQSGDIGYTIGHWEYIIADSTGEKKSSFGNYVTIWKKQVDSSWKYVFDTGTSGPEPDNK